MRTRALAIPLLAALSCVACAANKYAVPQPPAETTPLQERESYYAQFRPALGGQTGGMQTHLINAGGVVTSRRTVSAATTVQLGNGVQLTNPSSILPAVKPDSQTARHIQNWSEANDAYGYWALGGSAITLGVGAAGFATLAFAGDALSDVAKAATALTTIAVVLGGGGLTVAGVLGAETQARQHARRAWGTYDADLRTRLGLAEGEPSLQQ